MNAMPSMFLSHNWKDKHFVRNLAEKLQKRGVRVWIDEAELNIGDSLLDRIAKAILETDFLGVILSPNSVASSWVKNEVRQAMTQEIEGRKVKVLPILLEECDIPGFLADKVYADFSDPERWKDAISSLLGAMGVKAPSEHLFRPLASHRAWRISHAVTLEEPDLTGFEDITIKGVDKERLSKPHPDKELYDIFFALSQNPPREWTEICDAERRFPRHTMWRRAWIEGRYIGVRCTLPEVQQYHLSDLKQDVANTNSKYRRYLLEREQARVREQHKLRKKQQEIDRYLDGLEFD